MIEQWFLTIKDLIAEPWPWWVAGPMITFIMFILLFFGKEFGMSANFRTMCAADGAGDFADFFKFKWQDQGWNLLVALGAVFGGYLAANYFASPDGNIAHVSEATIEGLQAMGFNFEDGKVPLIPDFYEWDSVFTLKGFLVVIVGGFLVGFGARYAGGCTSGHAISGMSSLQLGSMYAVIGFFLGGLFMTHILFPLIFK